MKGKKTGGRKAGTPNKATTDVREAMRAFLDDPIGQAKLLEQYQAGELNPATLALFYYYGYGKPKDTLAIESAPPVLVVDELTAEDIALMREARARGSDPV